MSKAVRLLAALLAILMLAACGSEPAGPAVPTIQSGQALLPDWEQGFYRQQNLCRKKCSLLLTSLQFNTLLRRLWLRELPIFLLLQTAVKDLWRIISTTPLNLRPL